MLSTMKNFNYKTWIGKTLSFQHRSVQTTSSADHANSGVTLGPYFCLIRYRPGTDKDFSGFDTIFKLSDLVIESERAGRGVP